MPINWSIHHLEKKLSPSPTIPQYPICSHNRPYYRRNNEGPPHKKGSQGVYTARCKGYLPNPVNGRFDRLTGPPHVHGPQEGPQRTSNPANLRPKKRRTESSAAIRLSTDYPRGGKVRAVRDGPRWSVKEHQSMTGSG